MRAIRTAARALIVDQARVLAIKMRDASGVFYILPGGGQRHGETLEQGLARECAEEVGSAIEVGELAYVREYIGRNHDFCADHRHFHQLEVVFRCRLKEPERIGQGIEMDKKQIGVEWLSLDTLSTARLYPQVLKTAFSERDFELAVGYWGDVN